MNVTQSDLYMMIHETSHEQYWQGRGSRMGAEYHATGCGSSFADAIDDALEQAAMMGADADMLESRVKVLYPECHYRGKFRKGDRVPEEWYHYVTIYWN